MDYDIIHIDGKPHVLVPIHDFTALKNAGHQQSLPQDVLDEITLGQNHPIKILRKYRGMTQASLADAAGISRPYLTEIETGKKDGSVRALKSIAGALDVSLELIC
ncbi:MAG: helix-turn-helix transcriptional regulator [Pseudomonadota bacterium]